MNATNEHMLLDATVRRRKFFSFLDIITVEDPELIKRIELSGLVDRPHVEEAKDIWFVLRWFFDSSKFHSQSQDKWFLGMEPTTQGKLEKDPEYAKRAAFIHEKLGEGYTDADVKAMLDVVRSGTDEQLWKTGIELVNKRWLKKDVTVPDSVVRDTSTTLKELPQSLLPWKRSAGFKSTERVAQWVKESKVPEGHVGDMNHSVHTASQSIAPLLKEYFTSTNEKTFKDFLIEKIPVPTVLRTAVQASRLENILKEPLKEPMIPYKTLVIFDIGKAAQQTKNDRFVFGAGVDARQCPITKFFYNFADSMSQAQAKK